jgi:hypothetical protein
MKTKLVKDGACLIEGWKKYAPAEKFAGLTVEQFEAKFNELLELLRVMELIRNEYRGKIATREGLGHAFNILYQQVVDSVKGHPDFGRWSEFYRFLGYKTPDERLSPGPEPEAGNDTPDDSPEGGGLNQAA